jgi:MOSC domain-containing protein YiiM
MKASVSILCYLVIILGVDVQNSISGKNEKCAFHSGANWRLMSVRRSQNRNVNIIGSGRNLRQRLPFNPAAASVAANKNNLLDALANAFGIKSTKQPTMPVDTKAKNNNSQGLVIRTAARPHQSSGGSIPSSQHYTTRKPSLPIISVSEKGVAGDYNHYRTVALKSTADRAISILTHDVTSYIQSLDGGFFASYTDGDLGENVLVKGVDFSFFKVGGRYRFSQKSSNNGNGSSSTSAVESAGDVIIEVTEPMEPCANLCKLPFINDQTLSSARERVAKCQRFIEALGVKDGLRGWYAKVLSGGVIRVSDSVSLLGAAV